MTQYAEGYSVAKVSEKERAMAAHSILGNSVYYIMAFEPTLYHFACSLSETYKGGYWYFYNINSDVVFCTLNPEKKYLLKSPNGFEKEVNGHIFGIVVSLFTFSQLSGHRNSEIGEIAEHCFHILREYSLTLPEADVLTILQAID